MPLGLRPLPLCIVLTCAQVQGPWVQVVLRVEGTRASHVCLMPLGLTLSLYALLSLMPRFCHRLLAQVVLRWLTMSNGVFSTWASLSSLSVVLSFLRVLIWCLQGQSAGRTDPAGAKSSHPTVAGIAKKRTVLSHHAESVMINSTYGFDSTP